MSDKHLISDIELEKIVSDAKRLFATEPFPVMISKKKVDPERLPHIFLIEAFVGYLNSKGLLSKEVKFDKTK